MRNATIFILAAALAAAPATAQNETVAVDANTVTANEVLPADQANMAVPANDMMAAPVPEPVEAAPAPAYEPRRERSFPWGVIGLVGLIGLLGRRRRSD